MDSPIKYQRYPPRRIPQPRSCTGRPRLCIVRPLIDRHRKRGVTFEKEEPESSLFVTAQRWLVQILYLCFSCGNCVYVRL